MIQQPSPTESNGRGSDGRFAAGNRYAKGNPYAKRIGELRSALLSALSDDDWRAILTKLFECAKAGESWAIREIFDRTLGKPVECDLLERLEALEATLTTNGSNP